ncbi:6719_t:CDS:2 [Racocetra fulgida]|uniref:6719_t:CDS:1 n=1 Tax=Racocetra fulgida TaxID=60492 RepID=A0A9N9AAC5_9GLOM|nr:6719_t:CDS:2 [Racocetra fulgida]
MQKYKEKAVTPLNYVYTILDYQNRNEDNTETFEEQFLADNSV